MLLYANQPLQMSQMVQVIKVDNGDHKGNQSLTRGREVLLMRLIHVVSILLQQINTAGHLTNYTYEIMDWMFMIKYHRCLLNFSL